MKKLFAIIITLFCMFSLSLVCACGGGDTPSHVHSHAKTTTSPSCTEKGYTTYLCECGDTYVADEVSALGHNFLEKNYHSNNDATYEADGTKTAKCTRCDVTNTITDVGSKLLSQINFPNLKVGLTNYLANSIVEFDFAQEITMVGVASYVISNSENKEENTLLEGTTKVTLNEGINNFYVFEIVGGEIVTTYKIIFYRNKIFTVTFNSGCETLIDAQTVEEGYKAKEPVLQLEKQGYTFIGWDYNFTTAISSDITINALWQANPTSYKIEHYIEKANGSGYDLYETENKVALADSSVDASPLTIVHYDYDLTNKNNESSGFVNGDGSLVLRLYYKIMNYAVSITKNIEKAGDVTGDGQHKYGTVVTLTVTTNPGYTFSGWFLSGQLASKNSILQLTVADVTEYEARWQANTDTSYTVEHYFEDLDGEFVKDNNLTENLTGTTDAETTATPIQKEHFTFAQDYAENVLSGNINGDGSLLLKLFYSRDTYVVTTSSNLEKAGITTGAGEYKYETKIVLSVTKTNIGYSFVGWFNDETHCTEESYIEITVNGNVTYEARWEAHDVKYTVKHYIEKLDGSGYEEYQTESDKTAPTGSTATVEPLVIEHYTYNPQHESGIISGEVMADGSLVLKAYYDVTIYSVTVTRNYEKAGTIEGNGEYKYNSEVTLTVTSNAGYTFIGWFDGEDEISTDTSIIFSIDGDVTYEARWEADDIPYVIEYFTENLDGEYELYDTEDKTAKTDSIVTVTPKDIEHFTFNPSDANNVVSGEIVVGGNLVLKLYYTRNYYEITANIVVNGVEDVDISGIAGSIEGANEKNYKYQSEISLNTTANSKFTFVGWYLGEYLVSENNTIDVTVVGNADYKAVYKYLGGIYFIEYYFENLDGSGYTINEEYTEKDVCPEGLFEKTSIPEIEHFIYNAQHPNNITSVYIPQNGGEFRLKLHYDRKFYSLSCEYGLEINNAGEYKYGTEITSTVTEGIIGNFIGWYCGDELLSTERTYTYTVDKNVIAKIKIKDSLDVFEFVCPTINTCIITGLKDTTLKAVALPDFVTGIYSSAFANNQILEIIIIPDRVIFIEENSFSGCESLEIFCQVKIKPEGWGDNWNGGRTVRWRYNGNGIDDAIWDLEG